MTLGEQLSQTSDALLDLILATSDREQKKLLNAQLSSILATTGKLVDANVKSSTPEYAAATDALNNANAALQDAINDLSKTAETIQIVAEVINTLGKVVAML